MKRKEQLERNPNVLKQVQIFDSKKDLAKAQSKWSDKFYEFALYKAVSKKTIAELEAENKGLRRRIERADRKKEEEKVEDGADAKVRLGKAVKLVMKL